MAALTESDLKRLKVLLVETEKWGSLLRALATAQDIDQIVVACEVLDFPADLMLRLFAALPAMTFTEFGRQLLVDCVGAQHR